MDGAFRWSKRGAYKGKRQCTAALQDTARITERPSRKRVTACIAISWGVSPAATRHNQGRRRVRIGDRGGDSTSKNGAAAKKKDAAEDAAGNSKQRGWIKKQHV